MNTLSSLWTVSADGQLGILMSALAGSVASQDACTIRYRVF